MIGTTLHNRYRLEAELGRGGMAVVYRARDTLLKRDVAVKVLSATTLGAEGRARLLQEARAAASLNHPNIVTVHDAGEAEIPTKDEPVPYIVMELVPGPSLHDQRPEALSRILVIARQVCAALEHAHANGIIHRDLKPENVLLTPDGTAKLVDFGLVRTISSRLTPERVIIGTVFYLAPEQALGRDLDGRADLYALGVMLYELTTGQLPFLGDDPLAVVSQHLHAPVTAPSTHNAEIPPALDALIVRLLSKEPRDRPTSAAAVLEMLERVGRPGAAAAVAPATAVTPLESIMGDQLVARGGAPVEVKRQVFVARERELERLRGYLETALRGQGQVVFVTGGPGQGKTALMKEFARRAMEMHPDLLVASSNGNAYSGMGDPYLPFRDVLAMLTGDVAGRLSAGTISWDHARRLWDVLPVAVGALVARGASLVDIFLVGEDLLSRAAAAAGSADNVDWLERLRALAEQARVAPCNLEQGHLFEQYTNVLCAVAAQHPLLLILDDVQWADVASIGLLLHLGRRLADARSRVLIIGAYRPEEVALGRDGKRHPLERVLTEFKGRFGDVWIDLTRVAERESIEFVNAFLQTMPNHLGDDFAQALFRHTGGHPLFTVELLRAMQERGDLIQDDAGYWVEGPALDWDRLPPRVEGVIQERIARLAEELREILKVASVEGEEFTVQVVARVREMSERQFIRQLSEELETRHQLVHEQGAVAVGKLQLGRYRFAHALFQQYLYNDLSEGERTLLHREIGTVLEELHANAGRTGDIAAIAGQLARHYARAGDAKKERHYAKVTGERAAAQYANDEALRYLNRTLDLTPETEPAERYAVLLAREKVYHSQRERKAQADDLAALEELVGILDDGGKGAATRHAEVALRRAQYAGAIGDYAAVYEAAQAAIAVAQTVQDLSKEAAGHLQAGLALWRQGDNEAARSQFERALALARAVGARRMEAQSLRNVGSVCNSQGDYAGARVYVEQALRIFREAGERLGEGAALLSLGHNSQDQGDHAEAAAYYEQALRISREIGDRRGEGTALQCLGRACRDQGDYAGAMVHHGQALRIFRETGERAGEAIQLSLLGGVLLDQGDYDEARDHCERALSIFRETATPRHMAFALCVLGLISHRLGDYVTASAYYERALRIFREIGERANEGWMLAYLGLLAHHLDNDRAAQEYGQKALAILQEVSDRPVQGYALTHLGHALTGLGHLAEAADAYQQAMTLRKESGQPHLAVESLAGLARVSLACEDLRQALDQVEQVLSYLESKSPSTGFAQQHGLDGTDEPFRVFLTCYRVLHANQDPRAEHVLDTAHRLLQERAARIDEQRLRRSFLENVVANREIMTEYAKRE